MFRRLGVFVGGFSLDLALEVVPTSTKDEDHWLVINGLGVLVDRSFVAVDSADPPRYRMLEPIRIFAAEQLADTAEIDAVRSQHARAIRKRYTTVYERRMYDFDDAVHTMKVDLGNADAAMQWALLNDPETALALMPPLRSAVGSSAMTPLNIWSITESFLSDAIPVAIRATWALASCKAMPLDWHRSVKWVKVALRLFRESGDMDGVQEALFQLIGSKCAAR